MVPNPVNNNTKGFFPRAIVSQIRRPSANNQTARPQTSGLNRTTLMNNPFSLLVQNVPQTSGGNVNGSAPNGTNTTRASFDGYDRFRSPVPGSDRLQNFVKALQERRAQSSPTGAPQTSEFNYALNKVVR
jgi:wobble nucleotide-excising tRNase